MWQLSGRSLSSIWLVPQSTDAWLTCMLLHCPPSWIVNRVRTLFEVLPPTQEIVWIVAFNRTITMMCVCEFSESDSNNPANELPVIQLTKPRSGELRTQKLKSHLVRTQSLNVLPFKPGVGQYIAIHSTLTAREFFLAYFYPSSPFTCIFSKTSPNFFLCWPAE